MGAGEELRGRMEIVYAEAMGGHGGEDSAARIEARFQERLAEGA